VTRYLEYRAGPAALRQIREHGFARELIRTWIAPATGPKWLVAVGFDRALIEQRVLEHGAPVLLAGASAGAWRALALASPEPLAAHERLLEEYVARVFTRQHTPAQISAEYRALLQRVLPHDSAARALSHPHFRLAVHAVRVKGWLGSGGAAQRLALAAAALGHALAPGTRALFFEPTIFASETTPDAWLAHTGSRRAVLTVDNMHDVALASGSVPMYMEPIAIHGRALAARYLDGGLSDYHVSQRLGESDGLALLFSHDRRIVPAWFDKYLPWRAPGRHVTDNLLLVYPSAEFLARLPGAAVPSREDFTRLVNEPAERIRRWRTAVDESRRLGDEFLADLEHGRVSAKVQPLG
jgi:Patatin-like phospholipase